MTDDERSMLIAEDLRLTDELLQLASELTNDQIRQRIGELRAYRAVITTPERLEARERQIEKARVAKSQRREDEATRQPTYEDELEHAIAHAREQVALQEMNGG